MAYVHVLKLEIAFNCELEYLHREVGNILRAIVRVNKRIDYAKRTLTLAITTTEDAEHLLERLRPTLDGIPAVIDYWCSMAPTVVFAKNGEMDPTRTFLKEAWRTARKRNYSNKLQNA